MPNPRKASTQRAPALLRRDLPSSGPRILVVDDDADLLRLAVLMFRMHMPRAAVYTAPNGLEAIMKLFQVMPDVLVADIGIPGPNGVELCQLVRMDFRLRRRIKVIAITGGHTSETRSAALREGADDYLIKPFEPGELLGAVRSLLPAGSEDGDSRLP
jgi:DNA-binding response OmpR family regulator